jgi:hypothetical protein
LTLQILDLLG